MPELKELKRHKSCTKCRKVKNIREFYLDARGKPRSHCRKCHHSYKNSKASSEFNQDF